MERYKELIYDGKSYTEKYKIEQILISCKLNWVLNAEFENVQIEIHKASNNEYIFIFNNGVWYNGIFERGVFRNGEWRFGTFNSGKWYNGIWKNGLFKDGEIHNGKFYSGQFLSGKVVGDAIFVDCDLSPNFNLNNPTES